MSLVNVEYPNEHAHLDLIALCNHCPSTENAGEEKPTDVRLNLSVYSVVYIPSDCNAKKQSIQNMHSMYPE